jgi:hypothetical protein
MLVDIDALLNELQQLRSTVAQLRAASTVILNNAWEDGAREERQNVVAWLLSMAESAINQNTLDGIQLAKYLDDVADAIERGNHRPEET